MKRLVAYLLIGISYVVACAAGWLYFVFVPDVSTILGLLVGLLTADVIATVVVWAFGLIFRNSSFYDPYWSLIPWLMLLGVMIRFDWWGGANILLLAALGVWSWRLTVNWAYTCKELSTQDWRYVMFKQNNKPALWHVINFFGINMMPTLFVFIGMIPAFVTASFNAPFNALTLIGAAVILFGTVTELIADVQMHRFRSSNTDRERVLDTGLWRYSRHPNYLGEISVWFGVYFFMLAVTTAYWYLFVGAVAIFCLFFFISIPMMEKRQKARRASYAEYVRTTSKLFLLPRKKG